ncbi:MAG TPA: H4MPT-linked C1 transfer pathway protein, partial [Planctomycetaceae bacterium]|nr:H4MPT-linked C1 transfer pathway protein [Planctomycetaceae bacterium]
MEIVGIDIGGANIKAASTCGFVHSEPFPMWSRYDNLSEALGDVLRQAPPTEYLAVT